MLQTLCHYIVSTCITINIKVLGISCDYCYWSPILIASGSRPCDTQMSCSDTLSISFSKFLFFLIPFLNFYTLVSWAVGLTSKKGYPKGQSWDLYFLMSLLMIFFILYKRVLYIIMRMTILCLMVILILMYLPQF